MCISVLVSSFIAGALIACAILISLQIMKFFDFSAEGSFILGCACYCSMIVHGHNPIISIFCTVGIGAICGAITALLRYRLAISKILCGLMTVSIATAVSLPVSTTNSVPHVSISDFSALNLIAILAFSIPALYFPFALFTSEFGLKLRAASGSKAFLNNLSLNNTISLFAGLMLSNALIALAGAVSVCVYGTPMLYSCCGNIIFALTVILCIERSTLMANYDFKKYFCCVVCGGGLYKLILDLISCIFDVKPNYSFVLIYLAIGLLLVHAYVVVRQHSKSTILKTSFEEWIDGPKPY